MSRIGFDKTKHPFQLQLRFCSFIDMQGIQNNSAVTLDLHEGRITRYNTDNNQVSTTIREYVASDDEMKELYSFLTLDAIEKFENMSESAKSRYEIGYFDASSLLYLLISGDGRVSDGRRHGIYSIDPIVMALNWINKSVPIDIL